jgi:hypothetical protein
MRFDRWQTSLGSPRKIELHEAVHPPKPFVIEAVALRAQPVVAQPKSPPTIGCHRLVERFNDRTIALNRIDKRLVVRRPSNATVERAD